MAPMLQEGYEDQRKDNRRFATIEPPEADREIIEKLVTAYEEQTALLGRLADAARERDARRFVSLSEEQDKVTTSARGLAQELRLQ